MSRITTIGATASYVFPHLDEPPAFLVDAIPGARAARDAWQAANAAGAALQDRCRDAERVLLTLRRDESALTSDREPAEQTIRDAEHAIKANGSKALAALTRFDAIIADGVDGGVVALSASVALAAQARAVEARDALFAALDVRDEAWRAAGSPGRPWQSVRSQEGGWSRARAIVDSRVNDFAAEATERVRTAEER